MRNDLVFGAWNFHDFQQAVNSDKGRNFLVSMTEL
jgi:hypothetical protein